MFRFSSILRLWTAALVCLISVVSWAQQGDPPARVAHIAANDGTLTFLPAGETEWADAQPNRPLLPGDRLWTDKGSRASVQVGSATVHMDGQTQLMLVALDDRSAQLSITQGMLAVRVRTLSEGENFEIDTPNLAFRAAYPGDYRIDVDPLGGTTRVTIQSGTGTVYGEQGQTLALGGGQQVVFRARTLARVASQESPPRDLFDRWAAERNRREDQSISARFLPREMAGYQRLDASGQWSQDPKLGAVWTPQGVPANWAPYRNGRWEWIAPWGWTWIDDAPWAFAPSHYGRWALLGSRWVWAPGQPGLHPVYAPALVAFLGSGAQAATKPTLGWFPLAPGEAWQPAYQASKLYLSNVNRGMPPVPNASHALQHRPEAITVVAAENFQHGKPVAGNALRVTGNLLAQSQVVPPPSAPALAPAAAPASRPGVARGPADGRQVAAPASAPTAQGAADAQRRAAAEQERLQREAQARAEQQAREGQAAKEAQAAQAPKPAEDAKAERAAQEQKLAASARGTRTDTRRGKAASTDNVRVQQQARAASRSTETGRVAQSARARASEPRHREAGARGKDRLARRADAHPRQQAAAARSSSRDKTPRHVVATRKDDEEAQRVHAQQMELARRAAEQDAQVLHDRRLAREAWERHRDALAEQFRRDQQVWDQQQQQQRQGVRPAPAPAASPVPDTGQRGIPILNPGRAS